VQTIGDYAFLRCTTLTTINMASTNPPRINETTFYGINRARIIVNVPAGTKQAYRDVGWGGFVINDPDNDCEICGDHDCKKTHIICDICDDWDCKKTHVKCEICEEWDCKKEHKKCDVCNDWDCEKTHVKCDVCGEWDCKTDHAANIHDNVETHGRAPLQAWITNDILHIKGMTIGQTYRIFTVSGTLVCQDIATTDTVETRCIAPLPFGTYIIQSENKSVKFVKQ